MVEPRPDKLREKASELVCVYAPFWLQVAYAVLLLAFKPVGAWRTLPPDICFAGFAFVVWGFTMHMNAGKRIAGGGRERSTRRARKTEFPWCLLILLASLAGMGAGYREPPIAVVAWAGVFLIMVLSTIMLMPSRQG
jgi:hypothetical protein